MTTPTIDLNSSYSSQPRSVRRAMARAMWKAGQRQGSTFHDHWVEVDHYMSQH